MTPVPLWLPPMADVSGPQEQSIAALHECFRQDFELAAPTFLGMPVRWDQGTQPGTPYSRGFWHLITRENQKTRMRYFDPRRAERLPWCAPLLANASDVEVLVWNQRERYGPSRIYVWLERFDYVLRLEQRTLNIGEVVYLITAYHVDGKQTRDRFRQSYNRRHL